MCTARVDFKWSSKDQKYVRDDNNCHIFHDHCVQFRSIDHIEQDVIDLAAQIIRSNTKIAGSELSRQLQVESSSKFGANFMITPYEATYLTKM